MYQKGERLDPLCTDSRPAKGCFEQFSFVLAPVPECVTLTHRAQCCARGLCCKILFCCSLRRRLFAPAEPIGYWTVFDDVKHCLTSSNTSGEWP